MKTDRNEKDEDETNNYGDNKIEEKGDNDTKDKGKKKLKKGIKEIENLKWKKEG